MKSTHSDSTVSPGFPRGISLETVSSLEYDGSQYEEGPHAKIYYI